MHQFIPVLSPSFLYHPYIPSFKSKDFSFTCIYYIPENGRCSLKNITLTYSFDLSKSFLLRVDGKLNAVNEKYSTCTNANIAQSRLLTERYFFRNKNTAFTPFPLVCFRSSVIFATFYKKNPTPEVRDDIRSSSVQRRVNSSPSFADVE